MGGPLVLLLVLCFGLAVADRKLTVAEKLQSDADLSQVFKTFILFPIKQKNNFILQKKRF